MCSVFFRGPLPGLPPLSLLPRGRLHRRTACCALPATRFVVALDIHSRGVPYGGASSFCCIIACPHGRRALPCTGPHWFCVWVSAEVAAVACVLLCQSGNTCTRPAMPFCAPTSPIARLQVRLQVFLKLPRICLFSSTPILECSSVCSPQGSSWANVQQQFHSFPPVHECPQHYVLRFLQSGWGLGKDGCVHILLAQTTTFVQNSAQTFPTQAAFQACGINAFSRGSRQPRGTSCCHFHAFWAQFKFVRAEGSVDCGRHSPAPPCHIAPERPPCDRRPVVSLGLC